MRRLLLAIFAVFLALVVALLLALRSESFVLDASQWAVRTFTDLRLELRNPRIDFYGGDVSADEIHLLPASAEGPALLSVLDFSAHLPMPVESLTKPADSFLRAGAVMIYVSDSDNTADPAPMQWLAYLRWLPVQLDIEQVHLVTASVNTWIFPLKQLRGERLDSSNYRLTADADYAGEPLGIAIDLKSVDKGWGATAAQAGIKLSAPDSGSEFTLDGTLEGTEDEFRYQFRLDAFYRDIREFLKGFEGGKRLAGTLRLHGTMVGDTRGFVLSDASFVLDNMPDYGFEAGGRLEYQLSGASSVDLVATGELASLTYLVDWIDLDVGDFGRAQCNVRLSGSLDKPVIEAFRLTTSNEAGLTISMSGKLNLYEENIDSGPEANSIFVDMQGPTLAVLQHWLGELPYEPGPWRASGLLAGDRKNLSLRDLVAEVGTADAFEMRATGDVGRIHLPQSAGEKISFGDILLSLQAHMPDSAELGALLGRQDIPPDHDISASAGLSGTGEELLLSDGTISISASDMAATIGPISATLRPAEASPLSGLATPLVANFSNTAALSQYTSLPMPVLGPLAISARLVQKRGIFQLLDVMGTVREGDLTIESRGRIGDLASFSDFSVASRVSGLDSGVVLATALPDFSYPGSLGTIAGSFEVAEKQGSWTISKLLLAGGDDTAAVQFQVAGDIDDLAALIKVNLDLQFRVRDSALLEALSGLALKPLSGSLALQSSPGQIHATLKAQVGTTQLRGDGRVVVGDNTVQDVQIALATPHLYLQDFGFGSAMDTAPMDIATQDVIASNTAAPEGAAGGGAAQSTTTGDAATAAPTAASPLAQLRAKSPTFPVDLSLKVDSISGANSHLDNLQVRITGTDKRYTLEQFSAGYDQGTAEIRGIIDLNPEPPAMSLAGQAIALPLGAILEDVGIDANVSGMLTILGGVTVMGDTTGTMVRNLNGSVALALENAVIEGAAYDLLATDLLAWIYSGALTDKSTHLDCTMAKFQLSQGVATTDSLYIESSKMVASGQAKFDLVKHRMDVRITPLSKSRLLQVPSEVRLKGDMSSPKADISPVSAVADATSAALMLIPSLTLKLFGINQSSAKSYRPCQADLGA